MKNLGLGIRVERILRHVFPEMCRGLYRPTAEVIRHAARHQALPMSRPKKATEPKE